MVADQLNVALSPLLTALGPTLSVTVGRGALIDTVADCAAVPPGPVQVNVYVELAVNAPVGCCPVAGLLPDQDPEAVQAVAFAAVHDRVAAVPLETVLGLALKLMLGVADFTETVADWVAEPPGPLQVNV